MSHELREDTTVDHELSVGSVLHDLTIINHTDIVDPGKEVQSVGGEDLGLTFRVIHKNPLKHGLCDTGIQCGKGILEVPY